MDRRGSFLQRIKRGGYEEMKRRPELDYMNAAACLLVILIHVLSVGIVAADPASWQAAAIYFPWRFAAFVAPAFLYTAAVKLAGRGG
jgi:hypothetical protein